MNLLKNKKMRAAAVLAFFILVTIFYFRHIIFGISTLVGPLDTADLIYSDYYFIAKSLKEGVLPLWNPHIFSGMSLVSYAQYGLFYPLNLLFWLLPYGGSPFPYQAYEYIVMFHILLAGYSMYLLGRHLGFHRAVAVFVGTIYMLSPNILLFTGWGNQITTFAWFPLLLLFAHKAFTKQQWYFAWAAGLVVGIIILASPAQPAIQAMMLVGGLGLFWLFGKTQLHRWTIIWRTGLILVVGFCIGSLSLLPILEATPHLVRFMGADGSVVGNQPLSLAALTAHKLRPDHLLGLFFREDSRAAVGRTFFGIVPLFFAVYAGITHFKKNKLARFLVLLSLVSFIYALGWVFPYIAQYIPLLNKIREPQRYLFFVTLALPVLAGYGMQKLLFASRALSRSRKTTLLAAGLFVTCLLLSPWWTYFSDFARIPIVASLLIITFILGVWFKQYLSVVGKWLLFGSLLLIAFLELTFYDKRFYPDSARPIDAYMDSIVRLQALAPDAGEDPFRVALVLQDRGTPYGPSTADIAGFYDVWGYGNPISHKLWRYTMRAVPHPDSALLDALNVKYFLVSQEHKAKMDELGFTLKMDIPDTYAMPYSKKKIEPLYVYENPNPLGSAWITNKTVFAPDDNHSAKRMQQTDLATTAVFSKDSLSQDQIRQLSELPKVIDASASVVLSSYSPNRIRYEVTSSQPSMLVMSELSFPGWTARVNDVKTDLITTNIFLRGVPIGAGKTIVEVTYFPRTLTYGIGLSILASLAFCVSLYWHKRKTQAALNG